VCKWEETTHGAGPGKGGGSQRGEKTGAEGRELLKKKKKQKKKNTGRVHTFW